MVTRPHGHSVFALTRGVSDARLRQRHRTIMTVPVL